MGQKVNPLILKLSNTNKWNSKYFEKKTTEHPILSFKDVEIRNFIKRFFECNGFLANSLKVSYFDNSITVFVSYFSTLTTSSLITFKNREQKIKIVGKKQKVLGFRKTILNYDKLKKFSHMKKLNQRLKYKKNVLNVVLNEKTSNLKRTKYLQIYKNYLLVKKDNSFNKIQTSSFLNRFSVVLHKFLGFKTKISLILNRINPNIKQKTTKSNIKLLKKNLIKLRKYEQNAFFKESLNILFMTANRRGSSKILSYLIASLLTKLKRHNFFLRFIKNSLVLFFNQTKLNGIKIKIKGRFNGAPRSRHRIIIVGKGVPVLAINKNLDYNESVSFTSNGTFGVKVWISRKDENIYADWTKTN